MSRSISANARAYQILASIVALVLAFGCMPSAHAQTLEEAQYGSPTKAAAGNSAASGQAAAPKTSANTGAKDKGGSAKVLPATGGQSLPLIVLGTIVLGAAVGLLAVRRADRQ